MPPWQYGKFMNKMPPSSLSCPLTDSKGSGTRARSMWDCTLWENFYLWIKIRKNSQPNTTVILNRTLQCQGCGRSSYTIRCLSGSLVSIDRVWSFPELWWSEIFLEGKLTQIRLGTWYQKSLINLNLKQIHSKIMISYTNHSNVLMDKPVQLIDSNQIKHRASLCPHPIRVRLAPR